MNRLGIACLFLVVGCYNSEPPETPTTEAPTAKPAVEKKPIQVEDPMADKKNDFYDKEHTEVVLNRATRTVNDNCGLSKGEDGKATGPWGSVTIKLMLGHAGRMKSVTVPPPYADKPVGQCIVKAFDNLIFPPWAGADQEVEWTVELHPPPK